MNTFAKAFSFAQDADFFFSRNGNPGGDTPRFELNNQASISGLTQNISKMTFGDSGNLNVTTPKINNFNFGDDTIQGGKQAFGDTELLNLNLTAGEVQHIFHTQITNAVAIPIRHNLLSGNVVVNSSAGVDVSTRSKSIVEANQNNFRFGSDNISNTDNLVVGDTKTLNINLQSKQISLGTDRPIDEAFLQIVSEIQFFKRWNC